MRKFFPQNILGTRVVVALVVVHVVLALASMRRLSLTWDEPSYIGAGSQLLKTRNDQLVSLQLHPPLSYYLNSMLLLPLNLARAEIDEAAFESDGYIGLPIIFESGYPPKLLMFLARTPFVLLSALLGLLVWRWSRQIYGNTAAIVSLVLYLFSPIILANCRLATPDIVLALTATAALYSFHQCLRRPSGRGFLLSGFMLGLALLSKFTALLLIPTLLFVFIIYHVGRKSPGVQVRGLMRPAANLIGVFGIAFIVLWAGYGFQFAVPFIPEWLQPQAESLLQEKPFWRAAGLLADKGIPVPAFSYLLGIYTQLAAARGWQDNFLFGRVSREGWWYFYWLAFLIKSTLPFLICLVVACAARRKSPDQKDDERLLLYSMLPMILFFSLPTRINIGIRYLLPLFPLLCVFAGKAALVFRDKWRAVLVVLCIWHVGAALWIHPHYLAYFNELIGGPSNGHKYLVDSNLDWGQELERLVEYLEQNQLQDAKIRYFGPPGVLKYYGLPESDPTNCAPSSGVWAVSATYLQGLYLPDADCYQWLRKLRPKQVIGHSIFIYQVSEKDLQGIR